MPVERGGTGPQPMNSVQVQVASRATLQKVLVPRSDTPAQGVAVTRGSWYTKTVSTRNVTITLDEEVARWARIRAAKEDTSVSRLVGDLLREHMRLEEHYDEAMNRYLSVQPTNISSGQRYPTREEMHVRGRLR